MKPLLLLLNTPNNIINEAYFYIMIISLFVGVMFAYNLCAGLLRAIGNSFIPLVFLIVSSLLNVGLDVLFIAKFKMGIEGAAIATVIAEGISCFLCLIYIYHKTKILVPQKTHFKYDGALFKELMGQGFSMGLMMSIVSTGTVILQSAINNFGYLIIAGHTTARKLSSFCTMPASSLAMALATFVSQNRGANLPKRIYQGVKIANILSLVLGVLMSVFLYFMAPFLVSLLSGSSEKVVIENGARYLIINAPFYGILGILLNLRNS